MKRFLVGLLSCLSAATAFGGGPDVEIEKAHIDDITISAEGRVVIRVTGTVTLDVLKTSEDGNPESGNAKEVTIPMKSGELRWVRAIMPFDKIGPREERDESLLKLKGTVQHIQMWGTTAIVEGAAVTHVTATEIGIYPPAKPNLPDQATGQH